MANQSVLVLSEFSLVCWSTFLHGYYESAFLLVKEEY